MNQNIICKNCGNIVVVGVLVIDYVFSLASLNTHFVKSHLHISIICKKCGGKAGQIELGNCDIPRPKGRGFLGFY